MLSNPSATSWIDVVLHASLEHTRVPVGEKDSEWLRLLLQAWPEPVWCLQLWVNRTPDRAISLVALDVSISPLLQIGGCAPDRANSLVALDVWSEEGSRKSIRTIGLSLRGTGRIGGSTVG